MSRYHGPQANGAARKTRETKRAEAEQRNAATPEDRRAWFRRTATAARAALAEARATKTPAPATTRQASPERAPHPKGQR